MNLIVTRACNDVYKLQLRRNYDLAVMSHWKTSGIIFMCVFVFSTYAVYDMFYLVRFVRRVHLSKNRGWCFSQKGYNLVFFYFAIYFILIILSLILILFIAGKITKLDKWVAKIANLK